EAQGRPGGRASRHARHRAAMDRVSARPRAGRRRRRRRRAQEAGVVVEPGVRHPSAARRAHPHPEGDVVRRRTTLIAALLATLALIVAACSGGGGDKSKKTSKATPVAPLTGVADPGGESRKRPALSVKVENSDEKGVRPQAGLQAADVVYEEVVEGL